jgi:dolichol-phosphate mannosyltransferase
MSELGGAERLLVTLATYNESENLAALTREIHLAEPRANILVIDDNSPDGTGQIADDLALKDKRIQVLHRAGKLGLGTATLTAIRYAIEHGYDLLLNMDADFSHHPRHIPAMLAGMSDHDVMIGSRYVAGGGTLNWPWSRRMMSRSVNMLVRVLLGIPARDTSGAFRCYRVSKLAEMNLETMLSKGYSFQEEMLGRCVNAGCRIGETPIIFEERRAGASKANAREMVRSLTVLFRLGFRRLLHRGYPQRVDPGP